MKQLLLILISLAFGVNTFAQDRMDRNDKIKALKVAYITDELDLTKAEAEKFWPIYNTFEEQMHDLRKQSFEDRKQLDFDNLTEAQAQELIQKFKLSNSKKNELYNKYVSDLQKVISSKKIVMLKKVEDDFKRKMFEEFKKRRHEKKDRP
ncbi:sensor of ECF-type sigma factor [Hanstruepera neustonica]|uniref:Sensor of ECF-type sigma factor n=1 Tax=Hanstruepera neustonica TaxID=1445657 RepID=A0A2K1DWQ3_9FLAO|nr:sensor of ECF-type sigma factor [Hanstruepera neustonica]PNQ72454.1 sensor of ECF-type sigma factor [Hanstruepera neustonica]